MTLNSAILSLFYFYFINILSLYFKRNSSGTRQVADREHKTGIRKTDTKH